MRLICFRRDGHPVGGYPSRLQWTAQGRVTIKHSYNLNYLYETFYTFAHYEPRVLILLWVDTAISAAINQIAHHDLVCALPSVLALRPQALASRSCPRLHTKEQQGSPQSEEDWPCA